MAEYELDCLGEACPVPLMKVEKKMNDKNAAFVCKNSNINLS